MACCFFCWCCFKWFASLFDFLKLHSFLGFSMKDSNNTQVATDPWLLYLRFKNKQNHVFSYEASVISICTAQNDIMLLAWYRLQNRFLRRLQNRVLRIRQTYWAWWPGRLGNYLVCKRFAVQTLLWSLEFVIQINLEHDTIAVWNSARSWIISK